jgi:hypothetical protein
MSLVKFCFLAVTEHPSHEAVFILLRPEAALEILANIALDLAIVGIHATSKLILKTSAAIQMPYLVLLQ